MPRFLFFPSTWRVEIPAYLFQLVPPSLPNLILLTISLAWKYFWENRVTFAYGIMAIGKGRQSARAPSYIWASSQVPLTLSKLLLCFCGSAVNTNAKSSARVYRSFCFYLWIDPPDQSFYSSPVALQRKVEHTRSKTSSHSCENATEKIAKAANALVDSRCYLFKQPSLTF